MLNSQNNHKYTNISSNIEYQLPNDSRVINSFYNGDISNPEQIYSNLFLNVLIENNTLLNYLLIPELSLLSSTCKTVKVIIDRYYPIRLKIQYDDIKIFEKKNKDKIDEFLKIYSMQIPFSKNEWFNYDIQNAIETILRLDRKTIAQLRSIKKLTTLNENIYAPFCIIFNFNSKNEQVGKNGWKKVADNIISDSKFFINIANLKFENFEDEDMLSAFSYLNEIESHIDKISRYSYSLLEMINWCKAVVIYHILVHPYKFRNSEKSIQINSEMYKFVSFMDDLINKFYIFKGYLEIKKLIKPKLGEYIFTLDYQQGINNMILEDQDQMEQIIDNEKIMSNILSYLPLEESCKFISINKFGFACFQKSLNILCYNLLKKILIFKYSFYNELYPIISTIFIHNIFSNYFFMLEDIINPTLNYKESVISFLSKEDINDIKNYKGNHELINSICKIFCALFNKKVEKAFSNDYSIVNLYIKSVILSAFKGELPKLIRYFNIFSLNSNQLKVLYEELSFIYSMDKIKRIKNINKGFYQLLIWELYIFEYVKQFNPFLFKNRNNILDSKEYNNDQINIINIYIDMMNDLKYILNFKFHFDHLFLIKNKISSYDFISIILNVIKEISNDSNYSNANNLTESFYKKQGNISNAYFQCKNKIENRNKSSLYKRIMEELIILNIEIVNGEESEENFLDGDHISNNEFSDESFYVKNFLELNNIHKNIRKSNYNTNYHTNYISKSNANPFKENYSGNYLSPKNINKYRNKIIKSSLKNNKKYSYGGRYSTKKSKIKSYNYNCNLNNIYAPENYCQDDKSEIVNINLYNTNKSYNFKNGMNYYLNNNRLSDDDLFIIPEDIVVTKILFYLNLDDFPELSHVNRFFYDAMKTHIYIRLFFLEKKKNKIENINSDIITRIENKRNLFYKNNNISPPSLPHACYLLSYFNKNDVYELKSLLKTYKKEYEIILSVLCIFLNIKPKIYINKEGKKIIDFFPPGKNLFYNKNFIKIIQNIDLDSLNYQTFTKIEKIMQNDIFSLDRINFYYSPSLIHLINLEMGVMEYFRAIRKYCLNFYDYYILENDEIAFCQKMDEILKIYYKIKNYSFNSCQKYHQKSMNYLKTMDLEQNFDGEILDFSEDNIDNISQNIVDNNIQYNIINNQNENNNNCINNEVNNVNNRSNINKENDEFNQNNNNDLNDIKEQ